MNSIKRIEIFFDKEKCIITNKGKVYDADWYDDGRKLEGITIRKNELLTYLDSVL